MLLSHMSRYEEASVALRRARELDPLLSAHHALSAQVAFSGRDYDAAVQFARQAIVVDPELWIGHFQLAQAYVQLGASDLAFDALSHAGRTSSGNSKVISLRGYLHAILGQTKEAHEVLSALQAISCEQYVPPYAMALVYAGLRQQDMAMEWLERAHGVRDVHLIFLPVDSKWDPFRANTRFRDLLKRCEFTSPNSRAVEG
jgi:tetratricopeptide (TPR) repeat protein